MNRPRFLYELHVNITLHKMREENPDTGFLSRTGDSMSFAEEFTIGAENFTEVAAVLGRFHETAESFHSGEAIR
jgi:hypothetical protein